MENSTLSEQCYRLENSLLAIDQVFQDSIDPEFERQDMKKKTIKIGDMNFIKIRNEFKFL